MAEFTIKRSMSPDGKIDSVSVEMRFDADESDTKAICDAIDITDAYAAHVSGKTPQPKLTAVPAEPAFGSEGKVTGPIQAVFDGEPSKVSGKMGPGAIIIDGTKVKSFDKDAIAHAKSLKQNGQRAEVTYKRNDKWKSNDLVSIKAAV